MQKFKITNAEGGAAFQVMVTPNANTNQLIGKENDVVQIDLKVVSNHAAIDRALVAFLAEKLGLSLEKIAITAGKSVEKRVVIVMGITPEEVEERLFR
ncbi:MAG: hypothetical protein GWN00_26700 [Aliifodinibius sp.]|nr:DUF167 domain-containing protein [Fodinibius sp.]NIV15303.1 hypothetical protein [Fodinibius sp.]NIY28262.1 hypothetical protein [Fodinibius sp.]